MSEETAPTGWMTQEEWTAKGKDPEKWRPREEWETRGEAILPIIKKQKDELKAEVGELRQTVQQMADYFSKAETVAEQRGWQRAMDEIAAKQRHAVETADIDEYNRLEKQKTELLQDPPQPRRVTTTVAPEFKEFHSENQWYGKDDEMTAYADSLGVRLFHKNQTMTVPEVYAEISKNVRRRFPENFTNPRREGASTVEGATAPVKKSGRTFDDLPQTAKDICRRFEKEIPGFTKADYLKNYAWE